MNGIKQFRKNKQGFLLVDAMIGVLVVAIGLAALAALYTYGIGVMDGIGGQTGKGCTDSIGEN